MTDFSAKFASTKGKPFIYKGKRLQMLDKIPISTEGVTKLGYRILSTNSEWKQGIGLSTEGRIKFINGDVLKKGWFWIFEHLSPMEDYFECKSKNGFLDVVNIWDTGDGCIDYWVFGAAMWVENIPNGRRYHCNDGHPDDNFDDIVFEIFFVK